MSSNQTAVLTASSYVSRSRPHRHAALRISRAQVFMKPWCTLRETAWERRPLATRTASWLLKHGHRAFWVGRWAQVLGSGAWISATALF